MRSQSIRNSQLMRHEIPGLRQRVKSKLTTVAQEADRYGVGIETIRRAVRGETFRDVREGLEDVIPPTDSEVRYGRRATDVVSEADAKASLERLTATLPADEALGHEVDEFLAARKEQTK